MARGFRKVFERQRARTIKRAREQFEERTLQHYPRVIDVNDLLRDDGFDVTIIRRITTVIVQDQGDAALGELGLELAFELDKRERRAWIQRHAAKAITNTSATTRQRLREEVPAEGTLDEVVAAIDRVFDGRRGNVLTIARTETAPAFNYATTEAWTESEIVGEKEWLTAKDDEVRPHHVEADGQVVRLEDPFEVDGESLDFPGDPNGSPENIINCRCTMLPVLDTRKREPKPSLNGNGVSMERWLAGAR
jgi:SPP1 gp7 family putative phage head morphogenesis protein